MRISGGLAVPRTAFKPCVYMKNNQKSREQKAAARPPIIATTEQYLAEQTHTLTRPQAGSHS